MSSENSTMYSPPIPPAPPLEPLLDNKPLITIYTSPMHPQEELLEARDKLRLREGLKEAPWILSYKYVAPILQDGPKLIIIIIIFQCFHLCGLSGTSSFTPVDLSKHLLQPLVSSPLLFFYSCRSLQTSPSATCLQSTPVIPFLSISPNISFSHLSPVHSCSSIPVNLFKHLLQPLVSSPLLCGLVALCMASYFTPHPISVDDLYEVARLQGFTNLGEMFSCKLAFCKTIADECQPFLQRFQTSKPMTPYLFEAVEKLLRYLMNRCVKPDLMKCTGPKLLSIDTKKSENLILSKNIDIGFATKRLLGETAITVTERQKLEFIHECRSMLTTMIAKLQEKSPLKQKAVRGLSSLDPCVIQHSPQLAQKRFSFLLEELNHANIINDVLAENAKKEYLHFCNLKKSELQEIFRPCDQFSDEVGLDTIYGSFLIGEANYKHLWEVIKICLVLSHGNATVEGGFSVNKSLLVENMHEKTVIAQRHIHDEIQEAGGIKNIHISKKMLDYVRGARKRYHEYLKIKKERREEDKKKAEKRKLDIQVKNLEGKGKKNNDGN
uniref:Actin maturation protease n=1 Tax=Timema monikensis TaxID=170555 RepID=A0A7R9HTZ2_9NEOP|nr:unnamed protein product [Timema monikensis]